MHALFVPVLLVVGMLPGVAQADAAAGEKKAQLCLLCHKANNQAAYVPLLEGQTREYLYSQLKAYKEKRRADPVMQANAANLTDKDMADIADYFASRKPVRASFPVDAVLASQGKTKAAELKCATCHMPDYSGRKDVPRLAGIDPRYLAPQLAAFAAAKRAHPPSEGIGKLSGADAEALAHYFGQLD